MVQLIDGGKLLWRKDTPPPPPPPPPPEVEPEVVKPEATAATSTIPTAEPATSATAPTRPVAAATPRPDPVVDQARRDKIQQYVDENASAYDRGVWGTGAFKSEVSDERLAQALKGESSLGQLSADEQRLLTQMTGSRWRGENDTESYLETLGHLSDRPELQTLVRDEALRAAAADQYAAAQRGEGAGVHGLTRYDTDVLQEAAVSAPGRVLDSFAGQEARLGVLVGDWSTTHTAPLLQAVADGRIDPAAARPMVDAMLMMADQGDGQSGAWTDAMAGALAITRRPGSTDADRLARGGLKDQYWLMLTPQGPSQNLLLRPAHTEMKDDTIPVELRLAVADQIASDPKWNFDTLLNGWESDVVSQWMAGKVNERYAGRGTEPQSLAGEALRNTIGQSLGLPPDQLPPDDATPDQMQAIYDEGLNHRYYGANKDFDNLQRQIAVAAGYPPEQAGTAQVNLSIVPVTVTKADEGAMTLPVFRVEGQNGTRFVDHSGRIYDSVEDWEQHNQLPPGRMTYAEGLDMHNADKLVSKNTPDVNDTWQEHALAFLDGAAMVAGVAALGVLVVGTGGTAGAVLLGGGALAGGYTAARAGGRLADASDHGIDITDLSNPAVRADWIEMVAGGLSLGAGGVGVAAGQGMRLTGTAGKVATSLVIGAEIADGAAITDQAVGLAAGWADMTPGQRAAGVLNLAFYGGLTVASASAPGGRMTDSVSFARTARLFETGTPYPMSQNNALDPGAMRVVYDHGTNGRATNIRVEYNGAVDPQVLALHTQAARTMENSGGVLGRIDSLVRQTGANEPAVGTAAWEARIEIDKINGEIDQIQRSLSQGGLTPYEQAAAQSRLRELDTALTEEAARIPQTDADARGWVASPARGAQQAAAQGWPEAPAGYHWTAQANGTPRLDRLPGHDNLPQQGYDPATGQFVTRTTTPRGGLTAADTADRNAAIGRWMRGHGHNALTSDNAQAVIAQYRATARPPVTDSAGNQGTVAAIEVNGQTFVGLNSHNYAGGDGLALNREWAQRLGLADLPYNRQVVYHAEADALIQAHAQNDGVMPTSVTLYTDNPPCSACQGNLGDLAHEMGIRDLRIEVSDGSVWTLNAQGKLVEVK